MLPQAAPRRRRTRRAPRRWSQARRTRGARKTRRAAEAGVAAETADAPADPEQRFARLLEEMPTRREGLLGIVRLCAVAPQPHSRVAAFVEQEQMHDGSVFSAATLCRLLREAGALERVGQDGAPLDQEPAAPQQVATDGVMFLRPAASRPSFWKATAADRAVLDADDPARRLRDLLDDDAAHLEFYRKVAKLCARPDGATTRELGEALDHDPCLREEHLFAQHFTERLERCGAVRFSGTWHATELCKTTLL